MRKVTVALEILVQVYLEDGVDVTEAIDEMDYDINVNPEHGDVINTEIVDFEVIDSKWNTKSLQSQPGKDLRSLS